MANQYQHFLTAIDVGSAKTCALVAEITDSGLRYRGHGVAESRGSRKGVIVELDKALGAAQNVVTAVNGAGVHVDDTIFEPLACADSVLRADEREMGVCLADVGAGSTSLIVFLEGAVAHTGVVPIGGDHFTSDLAVGLCTPVAEAEKIKKLYGNAIVTLIPEGNEVEVPSVGDRPSRMISQRMVGEILEPIALDMLDMF